MPSRRQSMRFSSQTSSVTVTKTSVRNVVSSTTLSPKYDHKRLSSESFSDISSPQWISGSEIVFKTPKSPLMSRRSTIHHATKNRNDMDFKIPSLMFSSPPGIKTRSRRSSIYESSQQKNTSAKVQKQKRKAAVKRVGKSAQGKSMKTQFTSTKVILTDASAVSSPIGKTQKFTNSKSRRVMKSPVKSSSRAKSSSPSPSKTKSSKSTGKSSPKHPSPRAATKRRGTRNSVLKVNDIVTDSPEMTVVKQKAKKEVSSAGKKKTSPSTQSSPKRKVKTPTKRNEKSPMVKSTSTKKVESMKRASKRRSRGTTASPEGKEASPRKLSKSTSVVDAYSVESPEKTPGLQVTKSNHSTKKKGAVSSVKASTKRREKSPTVKSPPAEKVESVKRASRRRSRRITASPKGKEASPAKLSKSTSAVNDQNMESPKRTPHQQVAKSNRSSKKKGASSGSRKKSLLKTKSTPKKESHTLIPEVEVSLRKMSPLDFQELKQKTPSKTKQLSTPTKRSPKGLKRRSTRASDVKAKKSRLSLNQEELIAAKQTLQTRKSSPSKRSRSNKRTPNSRRESRISTPKGESPSKSRQILSQSSTADTPKSKKTPVLRKSPYKKNTSPIQHRMGTPSKRTEKVSSTKSSSTKKEDSIKKTANRRGKVRELTPHKISESSSRTAKKSPVGKSSLPRRADITLKNTPDLVVTSGSSRVVNLVEKLRNVDGKDRTGQFTGTLQKSNTSNLVSPLSTDIFYGRNSSSYSELTQSSGRKYKSPLSSTSRDLSITESRKEKVEKFSTSQQSSRWNEKNYAISPKVTALTRSSEEMRLPISSRDSLSSVRRSKRSLVTLEGQTSNEDFRKTPQAIERESHKKSSDSSKPLTHTPWKKRRFESEVEEIDRMVNTMVQAGSYRDYQAPSPNLSASKASPARIMIQKEMEAQVPVVTAVPLSGRKSLRVTQNITPSAAAPKARKILGVFDSAMSKTETSTQSYSSEQRTKTASSLLREYDSQKTDSYSNGSDSYRDDDEEDEEEEGSSETFTEETGSGEKEESSVQENESESITDSETDDTDDQNVTMSHSSQSQRCTIS